jgi:ribonuclease J
MTAQFLKSDFKMKGDAMYFVPLGGCGMFGANMALYGHQGKWIMVDCGMAFADETMPGVDILFPDPSFAVDLGEDLLGIVITHAHEDHVGAIQHLWPRLKAPLYATPFTAERIRQDLNETPWGGRTPLHIVPPRGKIDLGPFSIQMIKMAHSIPEMRALAITAGNAGTVLHTGDWKIDPNPVEGDMTDEAELRRIGAAGVLAVVGDSTNAMVPGHSGSELSVKDHLTDLFGEFDTSILLTCFSTNIARLRCVYEAAKKNSRQVCLIGRSLWQSEDAARKTGYLKDVPPFLTAEEAEMYPADHIVYVCTGSQGEPRAAMTRIANDDHPDFGVVEGDIVIFSSRAIPGNERAIERVRNKFMTLGAQVITDHDAPVHVSGHPQRDEMKLLYSWVKPKIALPVHGERMQLEKHAALAKECGVEHAVIPVNGNVIEISQSGAIVIGNVKSGLLALEGKRIVAVEHEAILDRKRIMWNGSAIVTIVVDKAGEMLAEPQITALGLLDEDSEMDNVHLIDIVAQISKKIKNTPKEIRQRDNLLSEEVRILARKYFQERFDRKPQTRVHLVRI